MYSWQLFLFGSRDVNRGDLTCLQDGRYVANGRPLDRRESILFSMTSGPSDVMGDLALVLKTDWYCGNTLTESLKLFARRVPSSLGKKMVTQGDVEEAATFGCYPPLMCTMT
jgi:hypothetical protein